MNWLPNAVVGDRFRWRHNATVCRITEIRDGGCEIRFVYVSGTRRGQRGYTLLPQDVELVSAVELLGDLTRERAEDV